MRFRSCFNPRSREGNDLKTLRFLSVPRCFNPRSREGNDMRTGTCRYCNSSFNPRSREGNDPEPQRPELPIFKFQSTFPQGERHRSETSKTRCGSTFQSTFPQGERRIREVTAYENTLVSIHVPARGTTRAGFLPPPSHPVSIHVPARGTTAVGDPSVSSLVVSIHVPARGTTFRRNATPALSRVSIHVPARGTTRSVLRVWRQYQGFNPRSRKGNDCQCSAFPDGVWLFQSTFPQGERRITSVNYNTFGGFQSTFPQGERRSSASSGGGYTGFQSTFPQGERLCSSQISCSYHRFNPRSRKGND